MNIACPRCKKTFRTADSNAGKKARCRCDEKFTIPAPLLPTLNVASESGIVLNPGTTFPLTILGVDKKTVDEFRALLDGLAPYHPSGYEKDNPIAHFVAKTGLRCKEVDDYVAKYRTQWEALQKAQEQDDNFDGQLPVEPYCELDLLFDGSVTEIAFLIDHTYRMSRPVAIDPAIAEILRGYEVAGVGDDRMCPLCAKLDRKKFTVKRCPRPPFHVGCRCTLLEVFD